MKTSGLRAGGVAHFKYQVLDLEGERREKQGSTSRSQGEVGECSTGKGDGSELFVTKEGTGERRDSTCFSSKDLSSKRGREGADRETQEVYRRVRTAEDEEGRTEKHLTKEEVNLSLILA